MGTLAGKTALVTGGSRGIGRAVVLRLVSEGAKVLFTFAGNQTAADEVVAAGGGEAIAVQAHQGKLADIERLFAAVDERLGGLDILVNNAAANPMGGIADATEADFDEVIAINTKGPFFILQAAVKRLRDGGRIVNLSSSGSTPGLSLYFASKAALDAITAVAARELGSRGITVNGVSPGATETDMMRAAAGDHLEQAVEYVTAQTALGRLGQPEDIADVVAFLAGPDSRWITGQNLRVSGGLAG
ncbi:SDR family oxidoreductase [Amycolatopsis sp. CA-230715]|uniref:SDR family oxidoreductase n=1 Tax=Amycolatopsis sp. CA-230715 TaxID=2745196 RepID=UPI001C00C96C|nr:SDR family oxidoreductase [Amycolatopsis sp. CA-230715]QWF81237.1 3-oxoacyl-[acyl-carrier-protein] reductase FabG [Amycolatopsis sp. CA-230715]